MEGERKKCRGKERERKERGKNEKEGKYQGR